MKEAAQEAKAAWTSLLALKWIVDKLHFWYHTGCRNPDSSYYVEGVDPYQYPELLGVDTEAAEQIFHIANRWQTILSNTAPVHQELFMLLFAQAHNQKHCCKHALLKYNSRRAAKLKTGESVPPPPPPMPAEAACSAKRSAKRRKTVEPRVCDAPEPPAPAPNAGPGAKSSDSAQAPSAGPPELAVLNETSGTVHGVVLRQDVYSTCGWSFQDRARVVDLQSLRAKRHFLCGVCYGFRRQLE